MCKCEKCKQFGLDLSDTVLSSYIYLLTSIDAVVFWDYANL